MPDDPVRRSSRSSLCQESKESDEQMSELDGVGDRGRVSDEQLAMSEHEGVGDGGRAARCPSTRELGTEDEQLAMSDHEGVGDGGRDSSLCPIMKELGTEDERPPPATPSGARLPPRSIYASLSWVSRTCARRRGPDSPGVFRTCRRRRHGFGAFWGSGATMVEERIRNSGPMQGGEGQMIFRKFPE